MTTRRTRRQNTTVRPRPRVYEPLLRAHDSNTSNVRETLVNPSKGKRLRVLRVRVIQEAADGRRLYEVYFWTLRILSGISEGICNTMVQSGGEFLYIGVGGR